MRFIAVQRGSGPRRKLVSAERSKLKAQYAERAVGFLHQAIAKGFRNIAAFKTDKDLDPLRSRADIQRLVQELEQKAKKR